VRENLNVFRKSLAWSALVLMCLPLACGNFQLQTVTNSPAGLNTVIILVRHAERDPDELDPPLNDEGLVRRDALRDVVLENGLTAIYSPDVLRNRQTIEPLQVALNVPVVVIPAVDTADTKALANRLVNEWLTTRAGGVILWVGNTGPVTDTQKGNLEEIYRRLGGTGRAPNRYSDFYVCVVPAEGVTRFSKATYGGKSSQDP
jgi:hypothetical protein